MEISSGTSFLAFYAATILEFAPSAPLMIMTSNDTHARTQALLAKHGNFGLNAEGQLTLLKQELVPTFADNEARFGLKSDFELLEKPHGHGDVHSLLFRSGVARAWLEQRKLAYIFFFQDTNPLAFLAQPATLGVTIEKGLSMNSMAPASCQSWPSRQCFQQ